MFSARKAQEWRNRESDEQTGLRSGRAFLFVRRLRDLSILGACKHRDSAARSRCVSGSALALSDFRAHRLGDLPGTFVRDYLKLSLIELYLVFQQVGIQKMWRSMISRL